MTPADLDGLNRVIDEVVRPLRIKAAIERENRGQRPMAALWFPKPTLRQRIARAIRDRLA